MNNHDKLFLEERRGEIENRKRDLKTIIEQTKIEIRNLVEELEEMERILKEVEKEEKNEEKENTQDKEEKKEIDLNKENYNYEREQKIFWDMKFYKIEWQRRMEEDIEGRRK